MTLVVSERQSCAASELTEIVPTAVVIVARPSKSITNSGLVPASATLRVLKSTDAVLPEITSGTEIHFFPPLVTGVPALSNTVSVPEV